jgi:nucleotide-binding universal stress UspA family protein
MKVLIVIDANEPNEDILRFSSQFLSRAADTPTILVVLDHKGEYLPSIVDEIQTLSRKLLDCHDLITRVRIGYLAEEIIKETKGGKYQLVIIGEKQTHHLSHLPHSSEAVYVAENAACPVIIVKGNVRPIRRILLCDSGAGRSVILSRFTTQLAEMLEGEEDITVLHVMSQISAGPGVRGNLLRASAEELIDQFTSEGEILGNDTQVLEQPGIHPIPKVRHGFVVDEILAEARSGDYDLAVIGAYRSEGWQRFLLDDLARKVLIRIDRPVLVVR